AAAVVAVVVGVAARARVRNADVALAVRPGAAAHVVAALADLIVRAPAPASPAVVAVGIGVSTGSGVRDASVALAVRSGAAAHVVPALADLVLAALHPAAAAVVPVVPDVGLATIAEVMVAVRPTRVAGGDVAGAVVARRAGVIGGAPMSACAAVPVVVVRVRAGAVARRLS